VGAQQFLIVPQSAPQPGIYDTFALRKKTTIDARHELLKDTTGAMAQTNRHGTGEQNNRSHVTHLSERAGTQSNRFP
jgi:hypothetical protein